MSHHQLGRREDSIYLNDSLTGPIKSGLMKLLNTKMKPKEWLVVVSWNTGRPGEVIKNYTMGSGIEGNPDRQKFGFTSKLS